YQKNLDYEPKASMSLMKIKRKDICRINGNGKKRGKCDPLKEYYPDFTIVHNFRELDRLALVIFERDRLCRIWPWFVESANGQYYSVSCQDFGCYFIHNSGLQDVTIDQAPFYTNRENYRCKKRGFTCHFAQDEYIEFSDFVDGVF